MDEQEQKIIIKKYGINKITKNIYTYKNFKYENLIDAIKFAEIDTNRINIERLLSPNNWIGTDDK